MYFSDFKFEAVNTVKRFSNFGFPYVIAPAFSTPAFSAPPPRLPTARARTNELDVCGLLPRDQVCPLSVPAGWLVGRLVLTALSAQRGYIVP